MDRNTWLKYFEAAAEPVQFYLLDEASGEAESRAQEQLGFEHDAWDRLMGLVWEAIFAGLSADGFQQGIRAVAVTRDPLEVEKVLSLELLYPLADLLAWDLDSRLQELGVPLASHQGRHRISLRPMSYGAAVRRIALEAKISLLGEEVVRRVRDIFVSYVKRVRTIEQVIEMLRRPVGDGGMGWTLEQAQAFIGATDAVLKLVPVMSEEEYSRWLQQTQREAEVERIKKATEVKQKAQEASNEAEELAAGTQRPILSPTASLLDRGVEEAYVLANIQGLDDYLKKRLRNVISTRLRGVRNAEQVREVLLRDNKVGGLGQSPEETERIVGVIEQMYVEYHEKIQAEERGKVETFVQEQQKRIEDRQGREAQEREAWYQNKLQSVAQGETGAVAALRAVMQGVRMAGPTCDLPTPGVTVSVQNAPASSNRVDAVQGYVRLTSLTEELEHMDLARFRRLAKTPEEAKKKVVQMFQGLKQESYERWLEGVKRWRQSPLQQMYLGLVSRAFSEQRPVSEIAQLQQAAGASLTPEEVGVIIDLNQQFSF